MVAEILVSIVPETADLINPSEYFASYTTTVSDQYDAGLNLFYSATTDQLGHTTKTYADALGRTVRTVYADGSFSETLYSVGTTAVSADAEGDGVPTPTGWDGIIPAGGYEVVNVAQRKSTDTPIYSYDLYNASGQLTDVWLAKVVDAGPNATTGTTPVNPHWQYAYDTAGNELTQVSGNGDADSSNPSALQAEFTTSWAYDQNGNKVRQLLPDGELQTWTYDVYGNNTSHKVYSATNHTTALQTTLDNYDTSAAHGGRLLVENRYSSDQAVGSSATPNERTTYTYDDSTTLPAAEQTNQGNVAEVDDYALSGGSLQLTDFTHYTYDPISGNQATITTADGTIHYVYDEATGNLVETWTAANASAPHSAAQNDVLYGYDNQGRLESVTQVVLNGSTPSAVSGGTRYDADGNAIATSEPTTVYTYDNAGNLLADAEPNGDTTSYTYNHLEQITDESITNAAGKLLFAEHTDWYDDGDKKDVVDTRGDGAGNVTSQITYVWTYDNDDRLIGEALTVQIGSGTSVPTPYADTFAYDLDNNRTQETEAPGVGQTVTETITYAYDGDDQLKTETGSGTSNYTTQSGYDADGNLISQTRTGNGAVASTYGYDLQNRMTSATVAGVRTEYTYDYNGVLTSETTGGSTTYDLNDPNNPTGYSKAIQQSTMLGGTPTTSYVLGLQVEAQSDPTRGGTLYVLVDGHGSTRALASTTGTVATGQAIDYDADGDVLTNAGTDDTGWLYGNGGVVDPVTGWTYSLARWLNGFTFTSYDTYDGTADDPVGLNRYEYADANPVLGNDPTGHDDFGIASIGVAVGIGAGLGAMSGAAYAYQNGANAGGIAAGALEGAVAGAASGLAVALFASAMTGAMVGAGMSAGMAMASTGAMFGAAGAALSAYGLYEAYQNDDPAGMLTAGTGVLLSGVQLGQSIRVGLNAYGAPPLDMGKQGKHIVGNNNYISGRSILTADPAEVAGYAGTGNPANSVSRGSPGFKERINFGKVIGMCVDQTTGQQLPTTKGIVVYAKDGIHIIPARP